MADGAPQRGRWRAPGWCGSEAARAGACRAHSAPCCRSLAASIFWTDRDTLQQTLPVLNSVCLGGVLVSAASVFCAAILLQFRERLAEYEEALPPVLFFWGLLWWLFSGLTEIQRSVPDRFDAGASLTFLAVTALVCSELTRRTRLGIARLPSLWLLPAMIFYALLAVVEVHHPLADGGWLSWPFAFAVFYFLCKRHEGTVAAPLHVGGLWLLTALVSWEVAWAIDTAVQGSGSWPAIAWALIPATAIFGLVRLAKHRGWPIGVHREAYIGIAGAGLAAYLVAWSLVTNVSHNGDPSPIPFVPLLNPLDLAEAFVLLVLLRYWLQLRADRYRLHTLVGDATAFGALAALAFVWLTAALLRTLHYWAGVPLRADALSSSTLVQTSVSIFWAVLALASMLVATRKQARVVWLVGATLLARRHRKTVPRGPLSGGHHRAHRLICRCRSSDAGGRLLLALAPSIRHEGQGMRGWAILMAVLGTQAFAGADLKPEDFAYALPVEVSGDAAAYRVPLPVSVYQSSARPDLGDLRVFNGQEEVVPYALERPDAGTSARESTRLPLFHLKDNSAAALDAVRITVESRKGSRQCPGSCGCNCGCRVQARRAISPMHAV